MTSFTETFGGSPVNPADVAYATYSFSSSVALFWPQFSQGQTNVAARFMNITTTVPAVNISMPDATQASVGYDTIIFNAGSNSFNIVTYGGTAIVTIAPGQTFYLIINNNSTQNGTWQTVQFGVGTGSAVASALAGPGLKAVAGLLQVNLNGNNVSSGFTITAAALAQLYVWTGGSGTIALPAAASVGNGFFFMVANNGSGSLTLVPSGGTIDNGSTSVFSPTQSGFIFSNGSNWFTVGKGIQNTFAVTLLNLNVSGSSNVVETSAQAQNIIQVYTGTLTGNIAVVVPNTVQLYEVNNMTSGAFTLTVKTASGTGIIVPQGNTSILYCDGTNVVNGFTASVTSSVQLANGSANSPSLFFQNSPTTGLFSPSSGVISVTASADEVMRFSSSASSVNYLITQASATTTPLNITATGTDTNIGINITPKGSGTVTLVSLDGTSIGSNTPESGVFTTLSASSTISGTGVTSLFASPPAIGGTLPAAGHFTTLSATSTISGSGITSLFASPPPIGNSAPSSGSFTTLNASSTLGVTGNVGIGTTPSVTYALDVVQAGARQAYFGSTGSSACTVTIDNAAGGEGSLITFDDAGISKWQVGNGGGNQFVIFDIVGAKSFIAAATGGALTLGAAQNFSIDQSGNATTLTQTAGNSSTVIATTAFVNGTALTLANGTVATTQAINDSSTKVATTAFVNPSSSVGSPGFVELPSGYIFQQGHVTGLNQAAGPYTGASFPEAFPNNCFAVFLQCGNVNPANGGGVFNLTSKSTTNFSYYYFDTDSFLQDYYWWAIGN